MFKIPGLQSRTSPQTPTQQRGGQAVKRSFGSSPFDGTEVCRQDFQVVQVLGHGGFGEVKLVRYAKDRQLYAMKAMEKAELHERRYVGDPLAGERAQAERDFCVEARGWQCPFIMEMYATFQTEEKLYYIFEYCPGGELFGHLCRSENQSLDEPTARFYAAEACLALEHLHSHGIVHRDVRLENMLIACDGHLKIADFGLVKRLPEEAARSSMAQPEGDGQVFYPPEFIMGQGYGKDLDCWQLGVAAFLMMTGRLPLSGASSPGDLPGCSQAAGLFCCEAMQQERTRRLGFPEGAKMLRGHAFFRDVQWDSLAAKEIGPPPVGAAVAEACLAGVERQDEFVRDSVARTGVADFLHLRGFSFRASKWLRTSIGSRRWRPTGALCGASSTRSWTSRAASGNFSRGGTLVSMAEE